MGALANIPRVRTVDPTSYTPFDGFSCGGDGAYEHEVDLLVAKLYNGEYGDALVRVAEDADDGAFIGFYVVVALPFRGQHAAYVALIGMSSNARGRRMPDGSRIGEFLLGDALNQIKMLWGGPPMPTVWALVAPGNRASHRIFDRWGFSCLPAEGDGYDVRYRPEGVGILR